MVVRDELGLDPDELGSPWGAAGGSFVAFSIGAAIPVIPYLFLAARRPSSSASVSASWRCSLSAPE